jgi:hypothetical protein
MNRYNWVSLDYKASMQRLGNLSAPGASVEFTEVISTPLNQGRFLQITEALLLIRKNLPC